MFSLLIIAALAAVASATYQVGSGYVAIISTNNHVVQIENYLANEESYAVDAYVAGVDSTSRSGYTITYSSNSISVPPNDVITPININVSTPNVNEYIQWFTSASQATIYTVGEINRPFFIQYLQVVKPIRTGSDPLATQCVNVGSYPVNTVVSVSVPVTNIATFDSIEVDTNGSSNGQIAVTPSTLTVSPGASSISLSLTLSRKLKSKTGTTTIGLLEDSVSIGELCIQISGQ